LSSTISKLNSIETEIEISVPAEDVGKAFSSSLARLAREAHIRGFRKGKAPLGVVKRMYGKAVLDDLRAEIVSQQYVAALSEHHIEPVSEPTLVKTGELVEGEPFACTLRVEVGPTLEKLNVEGIEIEKHRIAVSPEEIDGELKRIQSAMAKSAALAEPRPSKVGDAVRVELKRWRDGAWQEPPMPSQEIVLDEENLRPEMFVALLGASAGEEREIAFASQESEAAPLKFLAKVLEVKERVLPAIDDELAKDVGEFDTLDSLKEDIRKRIAETRERDEEKRLEGVLLDKLREKNPLELPQKIVDRQAQMMSEQLLGMMGRGSPNGMDADAIDKLMESSKAAASNLVYQHFLSKEIARLGALEVTEADVEEELGKMAAATGMPLPKIKARMAEESRLVEMKAAILERKVFAFVKPQVKITEVDAPVQP